MNELERFPTPVLSDALDTQGINGGVLGPRPMTPGLRCIGPAFTVAFAPCDDSEPAPAADYIDEAPAGSVIVIDNGGITWCTVWGGILSAYAKRRNVLGTVIYGACRDVEEHGPIGYPVYALTGFMKSGKNRVRMRAMNVPVRIGETVVTPGDMICADDNGVISIPAANVAATLKLACEIEETEKAIVDATLSGATLAAARARYGYNRFAFRRA
jgi:4-hydroxy-4-methyl-2-oxoglutarate aldolase